MINYIYQLVNPQFFCVKYVDTKIDEKVLIRPRYMSICHADQRYYLGNRDLKALSEKLPMALIHECCGEVILDKTGTYEIGQKVILIPNVPAGDCGIIYENYDEHSHFLSSGADGFMREFVDMPPERVVPFENIPLQTASICEFLSVAVHAVNRMDKHAHSRRDTIGIWGDGSMSYVIACALKVKFPKSKIVVIGKNSRKLSRFSFVNKTYLTYSLPADFRVDHAFECVGGEGCHDAIDRMIQHTHPQGTMVFLGVSENKVPINTRLLLEKGLSIIGSSRSGKADFLEAVNMMQIQRVRRRLGSIIYEDEPVRSMDDLHRVFETDLNTPFKTVFEWKL